MPPIFHSIRTRAFTGFAILFAATLLLMEATTLFGVPTLGLPGLYQQAQVNELRHLADVARVQAALVSGWLKDRRGDVENIARVGVVRRYLDALVTQRGGAGSNDDLRQAEADARRRMEDFVDLDGLRRAALIDLADGAELLAVGAPCLGDEERSSVSRLVEKARTLAVGGIATHELHDVSAGRHCLLLGVVVDLAAGRALVMLAADVHAGLATVGGRIGGPLEGGEGEILVLDNHLHALSGRPGAMTEGGLPESLAGDVEHRALADRESGDAGQMTGQDHRGVTVLAAYRTIPVAPGAHWGVLVKRDRDQALAEVYQRIQLFVIADLVVLMTSLLLISLFTRRLIGPVEALADASRRIQAGDLAARAPVQGRDEIARLATTFNAMADRVQAWRTTLDAELMHRTAELRESEERYGQVFLRGRLPQFLLDPAQDGRVVSANPAAAAFYGYPREVLEGMRPADVSSDLTAEEIRVEMGLALREERDHFEFRHRLASGEVRDVEVHCGPVRLGGDPLLYALVLDITERKRAERRLREAQRLADFGHWEWDIHTGQVLWSAVVACQFGLAESDRTVPLSLFLDHIHPDDREFAWARVETALQDPKGYYENEFRIRTESGDERYLHTIGEVRRDAQGRPVALLGTSQDVTARRLGEEALRRLAQRNRALMESALDGVFITRIDGVIIDCNQQACELIRIPRERLIGMRALQLHPESEWPTVKQVFVGLAEGRSALTEHTFLRGDGTQTHGEISATLVPQDDGEPVVLGVFRDITERYEREAALQSAREAAEAASRAKSAFLSAMSHELRTPLNAIIGHAQLLERDGRLPTDAREQIHVIARSGDYLLTLISDVLDISKIEAGRLELQPRDFDLRAFFEEVVNMFQLRAEQQGIGFRHSYGFATPEARARGFPVNVRADEKRLRQVLLNLLSNAVKFTERGEIALDVLFTEAGMRVAVRDTGRGIAPGELEAVFEPFRQVGDQSHQEGTGLGLPICRRLVRLMGGRLEVTSTLGEGSQFRFEIPLAVVTARPAIADERPPGRHDAEAFASAAGLVAPPAAGLVPPPANVLAALKRLAASGQMIPLAGQIEAFSKTAGPEHHPFCKHALELARGFRIKELRALLGRYG